MQWNVHGSMCMEYAAQVQPVHGFRLLKGQLVHAECTGAVADVAAMSMMSTSCCGHIVVYAHSNCKSYTGGQIVGETVLLRKDTAHYRDSVEHITHGVVTCKRHYQA